MTQNTKDTIQYSSAIGMLIAGVGLSIAGFIVPPTGQIADSVLYFFAQCLIYAGSIFGISIYINGKIDSFRKEFEDEKE